MILRNQIIYRQLIDLDIKNLEVDNIDNYLKISFETKNLQESFLFQTR